MTTLMQASREWANRPDDERFTNLNDLLAHFRAQRIASTERTISAERLTVRNDPKDPVNGLLLTAPKSKGEAALEAAPTHYAFNQLARRAGTPTDYARSLPVELTSKLLNYGLRRETDEGKAISLLLTTMGDVTQVRAATSESYGRVWNEEVTAALVERYGDGVNGTFKVPGEFGVQGQAVTKANTTIYGGDRNMFVFLADESSRINVKGRRNGKSGELSRGFFCWNSEVGDGSLGGAYFMFDYMCGNHIVWGVEGFREIRVRHSSGAPARWLDEVAPQLLAYSNASAAPVEAHIKLAQAAKIDDDGVEFFVRRRLGMQKHEAVTIAETHVAEEGRPIETMWDMVVGITAAAKALKHIDARVKMERQAGRVMDMVKA